MFVHLWFTSFEFILLTLLVLVFIIIPAVFYLIVVAAGWDLGTLRKDGWVFDLGGRDEESWYKFYSYYGQYHEHSVVFVR